ncbi:hypothetical protein ACM9HF_14535 [Colwellia sp. RE-S-Sl-9]
MKYLQYRWQSRLFVVALVSCLLSVLLVGLEFTGWAEQINQLGYSHGENEGGERNIPAAMMYILPFIKEFVLIGVPLLLTLLWIKLFKKRKM